jgi:hypothetical protein
MSTVADYKQGEPAPLPGVGESIHDLVIADIDKEYPHAWTAQRVALDLEERKKFGLKKYGTVLQAHNGRNAIRDALDEIEDCLVYIKQALTEAPEHEREGLKLTYARALQVAMNLQVHNRYGSDNGNDAD